MNGCETGEAKITPGFNLPASHVIHTVGPVWQGGNKREQELLQSCYTNSLKLACQHELGSIAFPNISTGVYRFPKAMAANIAIETVKEFLGNSLFSLEVIFVVFDSENESLYSTLLAK